MNRKKLLNFHSTFAYTYYIKIETKGENADADEIFKKLKEHGYDVTFIENCCNEKEKITHEYDGETYWTIAIAKKDLPERML